MYGEYCAKGDTLNSLKYICGFKSNIAWKFFKKKNTRKKIGEIRIFHAMNNSNGY